MVSLINFGSLKTVNGRTVASGSQSGLDTTSIIESLASAKRTPAVKFEDNIKINNNKINALTELKQKLTNIQNAVAKLRNPSGFSSSSANSFEARSAFVSVSNGGVAANYAGITASNGAPIGKFELEIVRTAVAQSDLSEAFTSLTDSVVAGDASGGVGTGKFNAGTFNINYTDSDGDVQVQSITLAAGSNLATVRDVINSKSGKTGVQATIVKFGENDYRLKTFSSQTGTEKAYTFAADTGTSVGFTNTAAVNAEIELDGESIIRQSNVIDDVISNVSITLYQKTLGEKVTVDIDKDNAGITTGIADFLTSYNDFKTFAAVQNETDDDGKYKETAYLNDSTVMDSVMSKLANIVGGYKGAGLVSPDQLKIYQTSSAGISSPTSLGDLGIFFSSLDSVTDGDNSTPAVENVLDMDVNQFNNYLQKYFAETRNLFEYKFSSDNSTVSSYKSSNAVYDNNIGEMTITFDHTAKTVTVSNMKDADGNALIPSTTTMNYKLNGSTASATGIAGTMLEGMQLFTTEVTGTTVANVQVSQGVGDAMFNSLDAFLQGLDGVTGSIDKEIESLKTQNTTAQESVDRIDTMIVSYRESLLAKFSALEALVSASNQTLLLLDAQTSAAQNG